MSDWGISTYLTGTYGSFGSIEFWVQDPSNLPEYSEETVTYHHPGSDTNTVILLGQKTRPLELTVTTDQTNYSALVTAQGSSASLNYPGAPASVTARLLTVRGKAHWWFTGVYDVQLSFLVS